ncbi:MAG: serpin family protein [Lachnospiraceae bacterium]|nr:serpin family protein [Lachnospiraceae bacterium]
MKKKIVMALLILSMLASNLLAACGTQDSISCYATDVEVQVEHTDLQEEEDAQVDFEIDYDTLQYQSVQDFGLDLFRENLDVTNPVISPVSAYIALTMAGNGAVGNTYTQFEEVLGEDMTAISDSMMNLLPHDSEELIVALANSAWIDDEFTAYDEWIGKLNSLYDAKVYQTDLASTSTVSAMNDWIKENTRGLIEKMIEEPFDDYTRLVLFNALYFNGKWRNSFEVYQTRDKDFILASQEELLVPMMHQYSAYYDYFENEEYSGVVMPYRDGNLAMVAILPNEDRTVRELVNNLSFESLSNALNDVESTLINLQLPKFEVEFDQILNEDLRKLGLTDAFDGDKADLSKMGVTASGTPIYISLVRQKAVVKVDEEGTEAAAVTEIAATDTCALMETEPIDVFFNRPFLYMIMDLETQIPLFVGIVDDPTIAGGEDYESEGLCSYPLVTEAEPEMNVECEIPPQNVMEYDWGVTLSAKDVTPTGMTLVCTQEGGSPTGELSTGSWYKIEKQTENGWEEVPYAYDAEGIEVCWTEEARIINHDGSTQWQVDWSWFYGNITEPGIYRLSKEIMDFRRTADYDKQVQYAEWAIVD